MKIIHTADIHLGSKMDSKFPREMSDKRKEELRNTFRRLVVFAKQNDVKAILLAGDVFDSDNPFKKDKEFFYSVIRNNPEIDFLYLRGNHDFTADYLGESLQNLKTFTNAWTAYRYGNIVISGIEITAENAVSMYSTLSLNKDDINIVMLHGQISEASGNDNINLKKLRDKNVDYLALGHIHKPQAGKIDDRADYAYCGCLEGRGFDETGEHGFILLDVDKDVKREFIPFAERRIIEADVDITGATEAYTVSRRIREAVELTAKDIYRINLTGEINYDVDDFIDDVAGYLLADCFFIDVKDKTGKALDYTAFENDLSLKGEFVRLVRDNGELSDAQKKLIINYGLKALSGGTVE